MNKQQIIDQLAQMEQDAIKHQMYGSRYLKKPDGSIVILTPEGKEMPLPEPEVGDDL